MRGCHDLRRVVNANKDAEEWRETVHMMKAAGALITDEQVKQISDYFIANYRGLERPKPVIVAGPANVRFKTWDTPTPGSRPHDPLATPDGIDLVVRSVRQPARPAQSARPAR